jgi:hypothetical protein
VSPSKTGDEANFVNEFVRSDGPPFFALGAGELVGLLPGEPPGRGLAGSFGDDPVLASLAGDDPHPTFRSLDAQVTHGPAETSQPIQRQVDARIREHAELLRGRGEARRH